MKKMDFLTAANHLQDILTDDEKREWYRCRFYSYPFRPE
jgi:hypothetical protein